MDKERQLHLAEAFRARHQAPRLLSSADVGLGRATGEHFARGQQLSPGQLEQALSPFTPIRGLAAFYQSVAARLNGVISLGSSVGPTIHDIECGDVFRRCRVKASVRGARNPIIVISSIVLP